MSNQKRVSLRLITRQTFNGWAVDVIKDGTIVKRGVSVEDPLSPDERSTCRWYLERYVECLPFSVDRAKEAEFLLENYPEDLLRQLALREVLSSDFKDAPNNLDSILLSIEVCHPSDEGGCSADTIHRLFWELLEDPQLWCHPRLAIVVQRSVSSPHSDRPSQTDRFDCWKQPDGTLTVNVLVVVARNSTQAPSMYDDISPFLATDALIKAQKILADTGNPVQIRLEIVRPGTFKSFVNHLERARAIYGKHGYFHVVHFDMHGTIGTRKGKVNKYGFLRFNKPGSDDTEPVPGQVIGKTLEKFKVPFAVLNACESARACLGDDANIAQQFLKHGVRNVLGMSFKMTSSAAVIFLGTFYHTLLVSGASFSEAAAMGRRMLRMNPMRSARYNRQQRRQDSFVAVTYGPGFDSVTLLAQSPYSWQRSFMHHQTPLPAISSGPLPTLATEELYGRDFDLLRLERRLLETESVYLYGWAGVGKSVFLRRAISLWKSTNFVDAVVAIDFSKDLFLSSEDVSLAMLRQLLSQINAPQYQSRLWTIPSLSLQSYNNIMVNATLAEILCGIESIIIFDGLDVPLMPHPSHRAPPLSKSSFACLCQLINSLVALSQNFSEKKPRLVFAARRSDTQWLEAHINHQFKPLLYELEGLGLATAIELSHQVLQTCGEDTKQWSYEDDDHLVDIVQLLACNPSALLGVLPLQRALKIEWRLFYRHLYHGLFASVAGLEQVDFGASPFCQEIRRASLTIPPSHFFFICLFALFWDEAVSVGALESIFTETANASLRHDFHIHGQCHSMLLSFALDSGYVRVGDGATCLHIHPLLSIVGRAYLSKFITPADRIKMRTKFCSSLESLHSTFCQQKRGLRIGITNILISVDFCLTDVPPNNWPLSLFAALSDPTLLSSLPLSTRSIPQEQIFQLLELLTTKFDEVKQKERYMAFFVLFLLNIVANIKDSSRSWERAYELSSIGLRLLSSLDQHSLALNTQVYQNCLRLVQFSSSVHLEDGAVRQRGWQALMPLKNELYERVNQKGSPLLDLADLQHVDLLSAGIDSIHAIAKNIQEAHHTNIELSGPSDSILSIALRLIEANKIEVLAATTSKTEKSQEEKSQQRTEIYEQQAPELSIDVDIDVFKQMLGFNERNLRPTPMANTRADASWNTSLENSYETGDWMTSLQYHEKMTMNALNEFRFEEADQHIESMRAILTKVSAPRKLIDLLDDRKRAIQGEYKKYLVSCTLYPSTSKDEGHTAKDPWRKDASGEPESTHKRQMPHTAHLSRLDTTVAEKERKENPRKWWEWLESGSSQGSRWVAQIFDESSNYTEEAKLMNKVHGAYMVNDTNAALSLLHRLDAICRDGVFAGHGLHPSPLQRIINHLEIVPSQSKVLRSWNAALASDDFKKAKALLNDLSASTRSNGSRITPSNVDALYVVTEREMLLSFTLPFHAAAEAKQLRNCQKLYYEFLQLVNKGELSRIPSEEITFLRSQALGMLMQQADEDKKWKDGISYCDEFLALCNEMRKDSLEARDACIQVKLSCEWGLAQETLTAAETNFDFDKCLELVDGRIATNACPVRAGAAEKHRALIARSQGEGAQIITDLCLKFLSDAPIIVKGGTVGLCEDPAHRALASSGTLP
ncbi:hypothetical protein V493_05810 [Pseudogymnoascus sp. VKM F-4281 (FW-2241)]|nr:hypothetical protein V493_05810 [Pseudogymnoascus sp. VKM F-4281 (FW-2241)]